MSVHKHFDKVCYAVLCICLAITVLLMNAESLGIQRKDTSLGYESRLFDTEKVHSIDIVMDDWDSFLESCTNEEYANCTVIIDGESYKNVGIRAKGNTSLSQVQNYGNNRYSFKIEFDHYDNNKTYYGLDKLCLNNIIQDNTYMKDYLTYQLMNEFGVASSLCSYVNISVNGETWGLYLAVESVEDSFLQRNYGNDYGELYKPDSMSMGGGRGNGKDFEMNGWENNDSENNTDTENVDDSSGQSNNDTGQNITTPSMNTDETSQERMPPPNMGNGEHMPQGGAVPPDMEQNGEAQVNAGEPQMGNKPDGNMGGGMGSRGSSDVSLIYSDDEYDSYTNIFNSAKTDITTADKDRLIKALKNLGENKDIDSTVDVEKVIRYFVVHNFVLNFDSYTGSMIHNYYLYEEDGQLSMLPWDYNLAFGGFQGASDATSLVNYPIDSPVSGGTIDSRPMLAWIFNNSEYTEQYHELFSEFISEIFDRGEFEKKIDSVKALISPYVENDPTKFCTYEEFETAVDTLKEFCLLRAESITGQLDGTIGSTTETQSDKTGFVDAGDMSISDMGSMNNSMGDNNGPMNGEMPQKPETLQNPQTAQSDDSISDTAS
jgi:spore coat protein CotH